MGNNTLLEIGANFVNTPVEELLERTVVQIGVTLAVVALFVFMVARVQKTVLEIAKNVLFVVGSGLVMVFVLRNLWRPHVFGQEFVEYVDTAKEYAYKVSPDGLVLLIKEAQMRISAMFE